VEVCEERVTESSGLPVAKMNRLQPLIKCGIIVFWRD